MIYLFASQSQQWLTDMLKGELTEVELDLLLEDEILQEIIEEQYQWYESIFVISFFFLNLHLISQFNFDHFLSGW